MRLIGETSTGAKLIMSNMGDGDCADLLEQLDEWPVPGAHHDEVVKKWAARNQYFTTSIDGNTGFEMTRIGRDEYEQLVCWARYQISGKHCYVLNHWTAESARGNGYYRAMTQIDQYLIFDVMGLEGVICEAPEWSKAILREITRNGFTVFGEDNGKVVFGYDRAHYEQKLSKERTYNVVEL